jgi:ParB-like chromosome segregation protein Spo0J
VWRRGKQKGRRKAMEQATRKIPIDQIKENRLSKRLFGNLPRSEFESFKADVQKRGVQIPIEVAPDNTIITGHQRLRALKELGAKEVEVRVRDDLTTPEKIELHMINDNIRRRQLPIEDKIKISNYLVNKYKGPRGRPSKRAQIDPFFAGPGKIKDKVAAFLGISKSSIDNYLNLLKLPEEEQEKVKKGEKTMKEALGDRTSKKPSPDPAPERPDQEPKNEESPQETSAEPVDPGSRAEAELNTECVKCGNPACVSQDPTEPQSLVARLIREFIKSPRKELCSHCLMEIYETLGGLLQATWREWQTKS